MLKTAEPVTLVIADISGYTRYLGGTELEHAENVLSDLMETVITRLGPTLRLLAVEGDAAFSFAGGEALDGSLLLDTIDACYAAFRRRQRNVAQATTCTCDACGRIPSLGLKFVAHHGQAVVSRVGGMENVTGTDVVIVHRLLKNTVKERLGLPAYALFTRAAVDALKLDPDAIGMVRLTEPYEDVGDIEILVLDLEPRWQADGDRPPLIVSAQDAWMELAWHIAAPASVIWAQLTRPEKRLEWGASMSGLGESLMGGRRGPGMVNHCAHGSNTIVQDYLEWRPFSLITYQAEIPLFGPVLVTLDLEPEEAGTLFRFRTRGLGGPQQQMMAPMARSLVEGPIKADYELMVQAAEAEARSSAGTVPAGADSRTEVVATEPV